MTDRSLSKGARIPPKNYLSLKTPHSSPSPPSGDHNARSAHPIWGNYLVAGLGSHWVGVRGQSASIRKLFFSNALLISLLPTLCLSAFGANANRIIKTFLQAGQSNADGRALTNGLPSRLLSPQPDVFIYYGDTGNFTVLKPGLSSMAKSFGPELTFGRSLADFFAQTNHVSTNNVTVAIIKYAAGGTSLYFDWAAGGTAITNGDGVRYINFQNSVKTGLADLAATFPGATIELDGMIWVQGETDIDLSSGATGVSANPAIAAAYGTNLVRLIDDVRLTYATNLPYGTNLPFFLSRISANQTAFSNPANPAYPYCLQVRVGQAYAATNLENVFMINTDGSQFSVGTIGAESAGNQHYDTAGQQALGTAFATAVLASLPRPLMRSVIQPDGVWRVNFSGFSGLNYSFQRAGSMLGPWSTLTNTVLGPSGAATFYDPTPLSGAAFYRVSCP